MKRKRKGCAYDDAGVVFTLASDTDSENENEDNLGPIAFGNVEGIVDRRSNSSDSCGFHHGFPQPVIMHQVCMKALVALAGLYACEWIHPH